MPIDFVDTASEYILVADNSILDVGSADFCTMCWFNISADGDVIISKGRPASSAPGWAIRKIGSNLLLGVFGDGTGGFDINDSGSAISLNVWHHVAVVRDNVAGLYRMYLDGVEVGSVAISAASGSLDNSDDFLIGAYDNAGGPQQFMDGLIDDVRQYSRAPSANEIQTIYASRGNDMIVDGLVVRYLMNEQAAGTQAIGAGSVKDSGPNGLDGTPTNAPNYDAGILRFKRRFLQQ